MHSTPVTSNGDLPPIYLALSGGGVRAMAFHSGLLRFLAEEQALERVKEISTVSGGTLLTGLIFSLSKMRWPTSNEYICDVLPRVQEVLNSKGLKRKIVSPTFFVSPRSWIDRIQRLSRAIETEWNVDATLADLPKVPRWIANATSAETGKRFFFSDRRLQCHKVGSLDVQGFKLSNVMAISAAVPGVFGPFEFRTKEDAWKAASSFMTKSKSSVADRFDRLRLYDGGVYDNLGLEQFLRVGFGEKRRVYKQGVVIVSDAGAPLSSGVSHSKFSLRRLLHVYNIAADQVRALRVADFMRFLRENPGRGAHVRIGVDSYTVDGRQKAGMENEQSREALVAAQVETDLRDLTAEEWTALHSHGYKAACSAIRSAQVMGFER